MKEKDLEKNLDNIIIDGLIKEAEQDNADFEAAMRKISDEEFDEIIYDHVVVFDNLSVNIHNSDDECDDSWVGGEDISSHNTESRSMSDAIRYSSIDEELKCSLDSEPASEPEPVAESGEAPSRWRAIRPWVTAALVAAAVILVILIPSINSMNSKLCESALYASEAYMTPSKGGFDVANASIDEIKQELPALEQRYRDCLADKNVHTAESDELQTAGWDLTVAYLKLHRKGDAVKVLRVLVNKFEFTPFGNHCQTLLDLL